MAVRYAEPEYWDSRYEREPALFEWFFGFTALRRIIRAHLSKKKPVLQIGCGTSNLQEGMAKSGYTVVNVDISRVVIQQMQERHAGYANLSYTVADCRCMPEFRDCQFGHVLDKGTVDALLCCRQGTENVRRMLLEVDRVLQPGGSFLLVTLGDPSRRLPMLLEPPLQWKVSVLLLPKISAACQAYVDGKPINDTTRPIQADGPYEAEESGAVVGLPAGVQYSNFFFAYVCKKQPLQLPEQGQRAQLPNGWVAGSKELFEKLQKELGLPEDLLDKGRRKRVVHVPVGSSASAQRLPPGAPQAGSSGSAAAAAAAAAALQGAPPQLLRPTPRRLSNDSAVFLLLQQQQQQQLAPQGLAASPPPPPPPLPQQQQQQQEQLAPVMEVGELQGVPVRPASAPDLTALPQLPKPAEFSEGEPVRVLTSPVGAASNGLAPDAAAAEAAAAAAEAAAAAAAAAAVRAESDGAIQLASAPPHSSPQDELAPTGSPLDWRPSQATAGSTGAAPGWPAAQACAVGTPPGAAVAPAAPLASGRAPRLRRFSTEPNALSLAEQQQQLAALRLAQAQHSERAADGLVLHDVVAGEAHASAAAAAAIATAVWGRTRPPRGLRLGGAGAMGAFSGVSSTSSMLSGTCEGEDDSCSVEEAVQPPEAAAPERTPAVAAPAAAPAAEAQQPQH